MIIKELNNVRSIQVKDKGEYATFHIKKDDEGNGFSLSVESSYGNFAHYWGAPGNSYQKFLANVDSSYVAGKMLGAREFQYDPDTTWTTFTNFIQTLSPDYHQRITDSIGGKTILFERF